MNIIHEASPGVAKAWGKQKYRGGAFRKLRYLLEIPCAKGVLVYNLVTGEIILLEGQEYTAWKSIPEVSNEDLLGTASPATEKLEGSPLFPLFEKHYLVPEKYDDNMSVRVLHSLLRKLNNSQAITSFKILPTSSCNARCFYCYESNYPHYSMTRETAEETVRFIIRQSKGNEVQLNWFGGEPLVAWPRIRQICLGIRDAGLKYESTMISNGYLFSKELAHEAETLWKMKRVQITLDGTEDVYNRTKAYVGVSGNAFQTVLDNIEALLEEGISVVLRMNLGKHNEKDLATLIHSLGSRFRGKEHLYLSIAILYEGEGFAPVHHSEEEYVRLSDTRDSLLRIIKENSLHGTSANGRIKSLSSETCMADSKRSILINPLGQLGKCEHYAFSKLCGTVKDDITGLATWNAWTNPSFLEACHKCRLYPVCATQTYCKTKLCSPQRAEIYLSRILSSIDAAYQKTTSTV